MNRKLLERMKEYMEESEVIKDGEWGACTAKELINGGCMPELYYEVCKELEKEPEKPKKPFKVFTATHAGHYLQGNSVVVAKTKKQASNMLKEAIIKDGIDFEKSIHDIELYEVDIFKYSVEIMFNGDY